MAAMYLSYTADCTEVNYQAGYAAGYDDGYNSGDPGPSPTPPPSYSIVMWATGSDTEIVNMVQAADWGEIDLTEYWAVGQERSVSLAAMENSELGENHAAQTVQMVIVALDTGVENNANPCYKYQFPNTVGVRAYPSIIVQQKNCLANGGKMNNVQSNSGSWKSCARRRWCNEQFKSAFPSTLLPIVKKVKVRTIASFNGTNMQETTGDYFFFPTEKEVFGTCTNSNTVEASEFPQWPHYDTASNLIKQKSGSNSYWWLRSPYTSDIGFFCVVNSSGATSISSPNTSWGMAVAFCI